MDRRGDQITGLNLKVLVIFLFNVLILVLVFWMSWKLVGLLQTDTDASRALRNVNLLENRIDFAMDGEWNEEYSVVLDVPPPTRLILYDDKLPFNPTSTDRRTQLVAAFKRENERTGVCEDEVCTCLFREVRGETGIAIDHCRELDIDKLVKSTESTAPAVAILVPSGPIGLKLSRYAQTYTDRKEDRRVLLVRWPDVLECSSQSPGLHVVYESIDSNIAVGSTPVKRFKTVEPGSEDARTYELCDGQIKNHADGYYGMERDGEELKCWECKQAGPEKCELTALQSHKLPTQEEVNLFRAFCSNAARQYSLIPEEEHDFREIIEGVAVPDPEGGECTNPLGCD